MNKYLEEASKQNNKRFLPETFEDYTNMHPSQARLVPMSHIKKLRDSFEGKRKSSGDLPGSSDFINNKIKWD